MKARTEIRVSAALACASVIMSSTAATVSKPRREDDAGHPKHFALVTQQRIKH